MIRVYRSSATLAMAARGLAALLALVVAGSTAEADWMLMTLTSFNGDDGSSPLCGLVSDGQGNLYGTTASGGTNGYGTVFQLTTGTNPTLTTLVSFNGANGATPFGGLIADGQGNLYGTTTGSGTRGHGTVFQLTTGANPTLTTLATFNGSNGSSPMGGLIADGQGNLYGTTGYGGAYGYGTVFQLTTGANPTLTTLVSFNGSNGARPEAGLISDGQGNLYGTTNHGGANGAGTVFQLTTGANPTLTTLVSFNWVNGALPESGLIADGQGNLYGTTGYGGANGAGTVFQLTTGANPTFTTLVSFNWANGANPESGLIADTDGNLYGTTTGGGAGGCGTVFQLTTGANPTFTTLVSFNGDNGATPYAGLIGDAQGNLYGTTTSGGADGIGTVFELSTSGSGDTTPRRFPALPGQN